MRPAILLLLFVLSTGVGAADVALIGLIGDKAAVLAVDGGDPKTVKVGQKWHGITVISVERGEATVEIDGQRRVLKIGQHHRAAAQAADRQSITLAADSRGHFITQGAINGNPVRFLVDTGATVVALPAAEAMRLGIDYRKGQPGMSSTAGGMVSTYRVRFDSVRLGDIEVLGVDGVVLEQGLDIALLGMSFLNRVEMKRDGHTMVLIRRF
ncbi:MAG TPA: TIGR02281 family clan AA aspartic protease [Burkholderiales bacterium]|jgi:aspartyl protease family protein|nr:TIGR02281 family clan AA aspartic protease [Burkholderiales bacterium]